MKRILVLIIVAWMFSILGLYAQNPDPKQNAPAQQPPPQSNVPVFPAAVIVEDILFASNAIPSAEIAASEIDMYLQCKNNLAQVVKYIQTNNLRTSDTLTLNFQYPVAQALINILGRSRFLAAQIDNYKRFIDALSESAKKAKLPDFKK